MWKRNINLIGNKTINMNIMKFIHIIKQIFKSIHSVFLIRGRNIKISKEAHLFKHVKIKVINGGKCEFGKCILNDNTFICSDGGLVKIDNGVSINRNSILVSRELIHIGEGSSIGPNVCIYDHDHKFDINGFRKDEFKVGRIEIGRNVWIAANCCIFRNTAIGDNCIIGAGVVVSGRIPSNTILRNNKDYRLEDLR